MTTGRFIPLALVAALGASTALNVTLYQQCKRFLLRETAVRLAPVGTPVHHERALDVDSFNLVVVGDSRARQWSETACDGVRFINQGVGNETTAQILLRAGNAVDHKEADAFLVEAGINDLKAIPLMPEHRERIITDCISNLRAIATRLAQSGKPVIITTVFPCGDVPLTRRPWWSSDVDRAINEVNRSIRAMEGEPGIRVFDSHPPLTDTGGRVKSAYQADLLHLSPRGYQALNRALIHRLASR